MTWSFPFRDALEADANALVFRIEVTPAARPALPSEYPIVSGDDGQSPKGHPWLVGSLRETGLGLGLRSWQAAAGILTFEVAADRDRAAAILGVWRMGHTVQVFATTPSGLHERIWLGRLQDMAFTSDAQRGARLVCTAWDASVLVQSKVDLSGWKDALFTGLAKERRVFSSTYLQNFGDGIEISRKERKARGDAAYNTALFNPGTTTNLNVSQTSFFALGYDFVAGAAEGACLVQPRAGGDPYVVTFDTINSGSSRLEGLGYAVTGAPPDPPFVTLSSAQDGQIAPLAWVHGHPFDVMRAVYTSTGTAGANGVHDQLPADWGLGLPYTLFDNSDILQRRGLVAQGSPPFADAEFSFFASEQADSGQVVGDWARPLGIFVVQRHGLITFRAIADPHDTNSATHFEADILPRDILGIGRQGLRAPGCDFEVGKLLAQTSDWSSIQDGGNPHQYNLIGRNGGLLAANPRTAPSVHVYPYDVSRQLIRSTNNMEDDLERRVAPWWCRIPAYAEVELGPKALQLVAGDLVRVTSPLLRGPGGSFGLTDEPAVFIPTERIWKVEGGGARGVRGVLLFLPDI